MKNHLTRTDMKRILKDWNGSFQISKTNGRIAAIHVSKSITLEQFADVAKEKKKITSIYPYEVKAEVSPNDGNYDLSLSLRVTQKEMMAFLKIKSVFNDLNNNYAVTGVKVQ